MPEQTQSVVTWNGAPIRGVLFDMDGVIADTRLAHRDAWLRFTEIEGFEIDPDEFIRKTFGRGNMQNMELFYPDRIHDDAFIAEKSDLKEGLFRDLFREGASEAVPGLHDFLEELSDCGLSIAIGSSAPRENIRTVIEGLDIAKYFPVIVAMEDVKYAKPDPSIFLQCCEKLELDPKECVVLEDSVHGLEAGKRAGCRTIGVTTMHTPAEIDHLCDAIIADFEGFFGKTGWVVM